MSSIFPDKKTYTHKQTTRTCRHFGISIWTSNHLKINKSYREKIVYFQNECNIALASADTMSVNTSSFQSSRDIRFPLFGLVLPFRLVCINLKSQKYNQLSAWTDACVHIHRLQRDHQTTTTSNHRKNLMFFRKKNWLKLIDWFYYWHFFQVCPNHQPIRIIIIYVNQISWERKNSKKKLVTKKKSSLNFGLFKHEHKSLKKWV